METAGQRSRTPHRACLAVEVSARPCWAATRFSASLIGLSPNPTNARSHCSRCLIFVSRCSERPHQVFFCFAHCARNHCSGVLGSHRALEIIARACSEATQCTKSLPEQASFYSTALPRFPSKYLRNPSASICALFEMRFVRLHRHCKVPYANRDVGSR